MFKSNAAPKSPLILLLLLALLLISTILVFSEYFLRPTIELELKQKITQSFEKQGLHKAVISVDGRDVIISGAVSSKAEILRAENTLNGIKGIRQIDNRLVLINRPIE